MSNQNEIHLDMPLKIDRFVFELYKIWVGDDVIVTSFKFSANNCPYFQILLNLQILYLVPIYNYIRYIYW